MDIDVPQNASVIQHHDNPAVYAYQDYMMLCNLSQGKAALLTILDYANGQWVDLLSAKAFDHIVLFCGTSVDDVGNALLELIAQGYVEQRGEMSRARYSLNIPVVQKALDEVLHQMSVWARHLEVQVE